MPESKRQGYPEETRLLAIRMLEGNSYRSIITDFEDQSAKRGHQLG